MTRDNAAQAILNVLDELKGVPNRQLGSAWRDILQVDDQSSVLRGVASVVELPDVALAQLSAVPYVDVEHYSAWESQVRAGFAQAHLLESGVQAVLGQIGDVGMFSLQGCARAIERAPVGLDVDVDGLGRARELVQSLLDELQSSSLPNEAKDPLLRHAVALAHALDIFRFTGASGVESALERALGAAMFTASREPGTSATPIFARFLHVLGDVATVLTVLTGTAQISAGVVEVLGQIGS